MNPSTDSLQGRLLLASLILLPLFLGVTGFYLEHSYRLSIEAAQSERMQLQVLTLLAEAEYENELWLPEQLLEARFNQPNSGLYGQVSAADGQLLWSSQSALALDLTGPMASIPALLAGERHIDRRAGLFRFSYAVLWTTETGGDVPLVFTVLESAAPLDASVASYRRSLIQWLGGSALLLIACQAAILAWGLRPLRELAGDITRVESGVSDTLGGPYPREIHALTDSLNVLLQGEKQRRDRVRNTLSDLAHSLKTPLSVIRSADPKDDEYPELVGEQTDRMDKIVSYQLQRATGGTHKLLQMVPVAPLVGRLQASLLKVYADRQRNIELAIDATCVFRGDERDLLEVLGNLMDNACKHAHRTVRITAAGGITEPLVISVEDDGKGIPAPLRQAVLQRGARGDSRLAGHGIGLAVAADIVASYRGLLQVQDSSLGGACIRVELPHT